MSTHRIISKYSGMLAALASLATGALAAPQFGSGIPAGWSCTGTCGTSADVSGASVVALPASSSYGWVSTNGGVPGLSPFSPPASPGGGGTGGNTNGSMLRSSTFTANVGELLDFQFNYITSDGGTYSDYAWARLLNAGNLSEAAVIFTARTNYDSTGGGAAVLSIPGFGLPPLDTNTTLTPPGMPIIDTGYSAGVAGPDWSPLGGSSGTCWSTGCGYTGWVNASYAMTQAGNYVLEFGVVNWDDTAFDTGMAFDNVTIGNVSIDDDSNKIPEPQSHTLMLAGVALLNLVGRRNRY